MDAEILIPVSLFLMIFGIIYLYFSTRNRERMALIEKGADASIFLMGNNQNSLPVWKIFLLNFACLLIGIGMAIFIASIMVYNFGVDKGVAYPGTIFLMAGIGLLAGFFLTKKLDK
ncbi:DUF6249 domain-containing protein [Cellulophaga tyrosinoxydans]|jgi:hypothetical protein|uniref:DUF6249 domain-containing protein n=1 Tax=Cellulophaga tyrosinoxydans TaxID=504486 RepID=A0A1W2BZW6_9FLAO|nr:DUF6249 domain-containing protein [Cellulophaga tyrosinoxydans]SMC78294.1 hypothetical protein SAMN05660703_2724 [Cellulophaga tyrosinoxydans]|tara:strand:+ start:207 stop:554 length:348 start_codon:yes stop_codon:yes gene_type:complete